MASFYMETKMTYEYMTFKEDKHVNGVLTYVAGEVYQIPVETGSVERWLRRGGVIVEAKKEEVEEVLEVAPVVEAAPEVAPVVEEVPEVEEAPAATPEEEVVNEAPKKENKKGNKKS